MTDAIITESFTVSDVHLTSAQTMQTFRAAFFRNVFFKRAGDESYSGFEPWVHLSADARAELGSAVSDCERIRVAGQSDHWTAKCVAERGIVFDRDDARGT